MTSLSAPAELIIHGRIATLAGERGFGWAEAMAIREGRVMATGSPAAMEALDGRGTRTWRLGPDQAVIPGLVDAHLHLVSAALAARQTDLTGLSRGAALGAIRAAHERLLARERRTAAGRGEAWLLGHGWSMEALGGWPTAALLEEVAPGRPVALWSHDHHSRWVSREALRRAGIDGLASDPHGGRIGRDESGRPDGMLYEHAAGLADAAIPSPGHEELEEALRAYAASLAALGVTAVHDPGEVAADPQLSRGPAFYRLVAAARGLPLRVVASVREEQMARAIALGMRTGVGVTGPGAVGVTGPGAVGVTGPGPAASRYRDGWLKLFADGALGSRSAALLEPYEPDDPAGPPLGGPRGMALRTGPQLAAAANRAAEAGMAIQVHAIGDAAVRAALDMLALVPRPGPAHHRIEHAQLVHAADIPRFATLGIAASVQACHLLSDAPAARAAWGSRTATAFPLRALAEHGALLPLGTDAPVEPADPWPGLAAAVARRGVGQGPEEAFHPEQAIDLVRALRAACLDGPRSLGVADEGHLGAGARADLVVIPADALAGPFDGPRGQVGVRALATARPLATLIDGRLVYRAAGFDVEEAPPDD